MIDQVRRDDEGVRKNDECGAGVIGLGVAIGEWTIVRGLARFADGRLAAQSDSKAGGLFRRDCPVRLVGRRPIRYAVRIGADKVVGAVAVSIGDTAPILLQIL